MRQARLFTPGPTAVPAEVLEAQSRPLIHHRTPAFREALASVTDGLQTIMKTRNPVVVMAASGTGGMDAIVANITRPGDTVIVTEIGKFSERWSEIARAYGVNVVPVEAAWGTPVEPDGVEKAFASHPDAAVLLTTHSETSTGVLQDVEAFARIAHDHGALIGVDGITSIGCHLVDTDAWHLDALVGGSQKGVMIPPGLAYVAVSDAAMERMRGGRHGVYYLDLLKAIKSAQKGDTPFTPAISLVLALRRALEMMIEEGLDEVIRRHARNARAVRAAVRGMGLDLLASHPSNATTAVRIAGGRAGEVTQLMETEYGVKVAGGQAKLKGHIVRLGHIGYYNEGDMFTLITAFEDACVRLQITEKFGAGVSALQAAYAEARR